MSPDWLSAFLIFGLYYVVMVIGLALLLHLQLGLAGIGNFGIVGFWGIGMYAFGVAFVKVDWPFGALPAFLVSLVIGTVVAGLAGLVIGWLIADLDIDGVMVGTLGFATIVWILVTTQKDLTGGALGMGGLNFPYDIGTQKDNETLWLLILIAVVAGILYYVSRVHRAPYGRLLISLGGNEPLARSLGKSTYRNKLSLFVVGSAGMGMLGALYGMMVHFLTPGFVGIELTLAAMVGLVLGGSARVWGAVIGVLLTVGLFDIVIQVYAPLPQHLFTQAIPVLRQMLFGATLIAVLMFRPLGILGPMRRDKLMRRMHPEDDEAPADATLEEAR
jgi:branched-chain amino acid transport system permease protein